MIRIGIFGYGNLGKPDRFRLGKQSFRITAQTAGEEDFWCQALMIKLCCPAGDVCIEITETNDAVCLLRFLMQAQVIPDYLQGF